MANQSAAAFALMISASLAACGAKDPQSSPAPDAAAAAETANASEEGSAAAAATEQGASAADRGPIAWTVDMAKSKLGFSASQTGKAFDGRFEKFDAKILFNPADLSTTSIDVTIDMTSAKTGDKQRDQALPASDWFKTKEFPTAKFVSTNVEESGEGRYIAHGSLTIRDRTNPIDLPFSLHLSSDEAHAQGEVTLMRVDFGVGQGEFATDEWVGLEVKVSVDIAATR